MRRLSIFAGIAAALMVAFLITGCKAEVKVARANVERQTTPPSDNLPSLVADNSEFAFDLYRQLASAHEGNLIFSPYSISTAFAMVYAGARGDTAAQMAETLHYSLPPDQLHTAFNALNWALQPPDAEQATPRPTFPFENPADDLTLTIANTVWGQDSFPFEISYLETLGLHYGAVINLADFSNKPDDARLAMRQWVEDATGGRIKDMPPPGAITPQTRLALLNAIYFKAEWTYPFNAGKTFNGTFHLASGDNVSVPMMVNDFAWMACGRGEDFYAVELNYGGSRSAAMLILLPDVERFQAFESKLDAGLFADVRTGLTTTNLLTLTFPRFKFESEVDLLQNLSAMGMTAPFDAGADFTGIASGSGLFIDYAAHKATISVDEQGTEASGLTSVGMVTSASMSECKSEVIADRPFIFAIYDQETSAILFLGRVMNPA